MPKEVILHLSDIHYGENFVLRDAVAAEITDQPAVQYLARKVAYDITERVKLAPSLIVVSGDSTETGHSDEFLEVFRFLESLLAALKGCSPGLSDHVIIVPGNHDIHFPDNREAFGEERDATRPENMKAKFENYLAFHKLLYSSSDSDRQRLFDLGYQNFLYPGKGLAVIGLDSCRRISFKEPAQLGHIANDTIMKAIADLNREHNRFPFRLAVFHHNPFCPDPPLALEQRNFLETAGENAEAFWSGGVCLLLHGHRHAHRVGHLLAGDARRPARLLTIGGISLGSGRHTTAGEVNGYQLIEVDFGNKEWRVDIQSRMLNLASGRNVIGRGRFVKDTTLDDDDSSLTTAVPRKTESMSRAWGQEFKGIDEGKAGPTRRSPLLRLERIQILRTLWLLDEAKDEIERLLRLLSENLGTATDVVILETLRDEIEVFKEIEKGVMNPHRMRAAYQPLYNRLCDDEISAGAEKGVFPPWLLKSEAVRLEYILKRQMKEFFSQFKQSSIEHVNELESIFQESCHQDCMSLYRRLILLITLKEFSHARQSLQRAFAVAPEYVPFYLAAADLCYLELRYEESLEYIEKATSLLGDLPASPFLEELRSLCYYFLGDLSTACQIAHEGVKKWEHRASFKNNYAFARTRALLRDYGDNIWNDPKGASKIFDDFVGSIAELGTFGVAHFNYALLVYWAQKQGKLDAVIAALKKDPEKRRRDLLKAPEQLVQRAFERAKNAFMAERDYFHAAMVTYFIDRAEHPETQNVRANILDDLIWDADNFISFRQSVNEWRRSFLCKDRAIQGELDFGHFRTLKRWRRAIQPAKGVNIETGGGYFVKWQGKGVVLNPGAGFTNNFQRMGYAVSEINAILVTSAHYTAFEELSGLLELIYETHKNRFRPQNERVDIFLQDSVFERFPSLLKSMFPAVRHPQVLGQDAWIPICDETITVKATVPCEECTYGLGEMSTQRVSEADAMVTFIHLMDEDKCRCRIGVVSSPCQSASVLRCIDRFDILLISVGGIPPIRLFKDNLSSNLKADFIKIIEDDRLYEETLAIRSKGELEQAVEKHSDALCARRREQTESSMGIDGLLRISEAIAGKTGLVILGDLPIDLCDKRHKIAFELNRLYHGRPHYLTEDVGLVISVPDLQVMCEFGHRLVPVSKIEEQCLGGDLMGPVKHFCSAHRGSQGFAEFMSRPI